MISFGSTAYFSLNCYLGANPPQPQAPSSGAGGASSDSQRDYSREWAMYYRQIGRVEEAEAIERQIKV